MQWARLLPHRGQEIQLEWRLGLVTRTGSWELLSQGAMGQVQRRSTIC